MLMKLESVRPSSAVRVRRGIRVLLVIALSAMALAGCGSSRSLKGGDAGADSQSAATASEEGAGATTACADLTGEQALKKWGSMVPAAWSDLAADDPRSWDFQGAPVDTYDPCAGLSWITLSIHDPALSSPRQIMLFHHGEFAGTATARPYGFAPKVSRTSDDTLSVTYTWAQDGEEPKSASGSCTATYTWDESSGAATQTGDLPPEKELTATDQAPAPVPGAFPGAGGPRPANAVPITAFYNSGGNTGPAIIVTPSGNIGCDISFSEFEDTGCGIRSYLQDRPFGVDEIGHTLWWVTGFNSGGQPHMAMRGGASSYQLGQENPQQYTAPMVVDYGQVVYYRTIVCASAENGLTCWNTDTGHGAFMNRQTTLFF